MCLHVCMCTCVYVCVCMYVCLCVPLYGLFLSRSPQGLCARVRMCVYVCVWCLGVFVCLCVALCVVSLTFFTLSVQVRVCDSVAQCTSGDSSAACALVQHIRRPLGDATPLLLRLPRRLRCLQCTVSHPCTYRAPHTLKSVAESGVFWVYASSLFLNGHCVRYAGVLRVYHKEVRVTM